MNGWWLVSYLVLWALLALTLLVLLVVLRQLGFIYTQSGVSIRLEEGPTLGASIPPIDGVEELAERLVLARTTSAAVAGQH